MDMKTRLYRKAFHSKVPKKQTKKYRKYTGEKKQMKILVYSFALLKLARLCPSVGRGSYKFYFRVGYFYIFYNGYQVKVVDLRMENRISS